MTKTEYMYGKGFDKEVLKKQIEICEYKLERISLLLYELLKVNMYARDEDRIRILINARDWNEEVIRDSKEMLRGSFYR